MAIYNNVLMWILLCCIFALLIRMKFEINNSKKIKLENTSLKNNISQQIQNLSVSREELLLEKIEFEKEKNIFKTNQDAYEKNIQKSLNQLFRITTESLNDNFFKFSENFLLYPELKFTINNFSAKDIANYAITATDSIQYKEYKQLKIKSAPDSSEVKDSLTHGYIYTMYNLSIPGVVKIGCSDAPNVRAKELTVGEDFPSNKTYAQCKKNLDKYHIGSPPQMTMY